MAILSLRVLKHEKERETKRRKGKVISSNNRLGETRELKREKKIC